PALGNVFHVVSLVAMGLWLIDNMNLEDLAKAAADRKRWEFLLTVAPLRLKSVTGSPGNPVAVVLTARACRRPLPRGRFLHQCRGPRGGIGADLRFLFAHHVKQPVEGLARDVVVEVEALRLGEGDGLELADEGLVLPRHANVIHALADDGLEGRGELVRRLG